MPRGDAGGLTRAREGDHVAREVAERPPERVGVERRDTGRRAQRDAVDASIAIAESGEAGAARGGIVEEPLRERGEGERALWRDGIALPQLQLPTRA